MTAKILTEFGASLSILFAFDIFIKFTCVDYRVTVVIQMIN